MIRLWINRVLCIIHVHHWTYKVRGNIICESCVHCGKSIEIGDGQIRGKWLYDLKCNNVHRTNLNTFEYQVFAEDVDKWYCVRSE